MEIVKQPPFQTVDIADAAITAAKLGYADDALVIAQHGINAVASGAALKAAYLVAAALTPGGSPLAIDNRSMVYAPGGGYDGGTEGFDFDTDFVDVIGEGVCRKLENGEIAFPATHLFCDTDTEVVFVTCRDIHMRGFHIEQETDGAGNRGLVIDNANACDRGRFIDIGVTMSNAARKAIDDGTNTDIGAYFEQCHSLAVILQAVTLSGYCLRCSGASSSFAGNGTLTGTCIECTAMLNSFAGSGTLSGICKRCIGTTDAFGGLGTLSGICEDCLGNIGSFGGGSNSGTSAVLRRCRSLGRSDAIKKWQGLMEDCIIEVIIAGKHAVEVIRDYIGAAGRLVTGGDTDTIIFAGNDYSAEFPVGSFIRHPTSATWHRVLTVAFAAGNTTVEMADVAGATWNGETVQACSAPRLFNNTLITVNTEAVDTDAESPILMAHNRINVDITANVKNQIGTGYNVVDAELVSAYKDL